MSVNIPLTIACGNYELVRPIKEGRVKAEGIDLTVITNLSARERHWRMARGEEFDICEYNAPNYVMAHDRGMNYTALPIFLHRRFRHGFTFVNPASDIKSPKDLIGRSVGGTNFGPAANIWMRGILEEHYGVPHKEITWVVERPDDIDFDPSPGLKIEMIGPDKSLDDMLLSGELDALMQPTFPKPFLEGHPNIARLWLDYQAEELRYWQQSRIFPIMHVTVIRSTLLKQHPWMAGNLMRAFDEAKQLAYGYVQNPRVVPLAWFSTYWEEERKLLGADPWEYGLTENNRKNLETMIGYTFNQGLIGQKYSVDELFVDFDMDVLRRDNITY